MLDIDDTVKPVFGTGSREPSTETPMRRA